MKAPPLAALALAAILHPVVAAAQDGEITLGAQDRAALDLTVYGNGRAQVTDRRIADLPAGVGTVAFEDVSRAMDPTSAVIGGSGLTVAEQTFQGDVISQEALLKRSVGDTIRVIRNHPTTGEEIVETATVLAVDGGLVLQMADRIETGAPGRLVFDSVPDDLRVRPTLLARLTGAAGGPTPLTLSYLTDGMTWHADYVLIVEGNGAAPRLDVAGRATIVNNSGIAYRNAGLQLVAGDPRRASPGPVPVMRTMQADAEFSDMASAEMAPQALGDLHIYTLPGTVDLADQETKQLTLITAPAVTSQRRYISTGNVGPNARGSQTDESRPDVRLSFVNDSESGLGRPLPAGLVRVYERDPEGQPRFTGEARIGHTAVGGDVDIDIGRAFDITIERTQTAYSAQGRPLSSYDTSWRVEIDNAKDTPVSVEVTERITGTWEILSESHVHSQKDANTVTWVIDVPAEGTVALNFRVSARLNR